MIVPVPVAIVGLGRIAVGYDLEAKGDTVFTHTRACALHPECALAGGVDPDAAARERFSRIYGAPSFATFSELAAVCGAPGVVILATPASVRLVAIREIVRARPAMVLIEKPIATSMEEADEVLALCREAGVSVAVNYIRRFDPALGALASLAAAAGFGEPVACDVVYTGDLIESGSHYVDLLCAWFRERAETRPLSHSDVHALRFGRVPVTLRRVGTAYGLGEIDIFFERGRVRVLEYGERIEAWRNGPDPFFPGYERLQPVPAPAQPSMQRYQAHVLDGLLRSLREGRDAASNGATARETLRICLELAGPR